MVLTAPMVLTASRARRVTRARRVKLVPQVQWVRQAPRASRARRAMQGEAADLPPGLSPEEILGILAADHVAAMVLEHSSEAYGALNELTPARIGAGTGILLRVGQEATVKAVVRTQDGSVIEGADLVWSIDEEEENIKVEDGVITALASNYNVDDAKYSASKISFKSPSHLVAGELSVNVSNAVAKVTLNPKGPLSLAIGQSRTVTASALDGDDKAVPDIGSMGNFDWDPESGVSVAVDKHPKGHAMAGGFVMPGGGSAKITAGSSGEADVVVSIEGKSATLTVDVSGPRILREIVYSSPGTNTFTWNQDQNTPEWDGDETVVGATGVTVGTASASAGATAADLVEGNVYTSFTVELLNSRGEPITTFDHTDLRITVTQVAMAGLQAYWSGDDKRVMTVLLQFTSWLVQIPSQTVYVSALTRTFRMLRVSELMVSRRRLAVVG